MKVLVIGESCTDKFIYGNVDRLNPEAPTQIFTPLYEKENSGMGGNVAEHLKNLNISFDFITNKEKIIKTRYVDEASNYILLRVDEDIKLAPTNQIINVRLYNFIIISDYNKGFLTEDYMQSLINFATIANRLVFLDTKKNLGKWSYKAWTKINEKEYSRHHDFLNKDQTVITLGKAGVKYRDEIIPPEAEILTRDVVGAGDTFLVFFALYFYKDRNVISAIKKANHYAGIACLSKGVRNDFLDFIPKADIL